MRRMLLNSFLVVVVLVGGQRALVAAEGSGGGSCTWLCKPDCPGDGGAALCLAQVTNGNCHLLVVCATGFEDCPTSNFIGCIPF